MNAKKLEDILAILKAITTVAALVPSPVQMFAPMALSIEQIAFKALEAHIAASGQTADEIIAKFHKVNIPDG